MYYPDSLTEQQLLEILIGALDSIHDAIVTIDSAHTIIFFNKKAEEIFGYKREDVIGKDLSTIMSPNCAKDHKRAVARYLETRIPTRIGMHNEITAVRKNGEPFPAEISFFVSRSNDRDYFTAIIRDLSDSKEIESRLLACENLANIGKITAEVAHEIKNPLISIGGFARQLKRSITDEDASRKLDIIVKEVARLERLLRDLREYRKPRTQEKQKLNVNLILQELKEFLEPTLMEANAKIDLHLSQEPLWTIGNKDRLRQAFLNLFQNAIEALVDEGRIVVKTGVQGQKIFVEITDNGCGLTEEEKKRIFDPFYTTKPMGTGLGLCVVKNIVEEHNGDEIVVESKKGEGTKVVISLPLATD
jgi:PAS domain S-box-containing protein